MAAVAVSSETDDLFATKGKWKRNGTKGFSESKKRFSPALARVDTPLQTFSTGSLPEGYVR